MTISLTKGQFALVDDSDYESLARFNWYAMRSGHSWYAARGGPKVCGIRTPQVLLMHRVIMGTDAALHTDHIDGNGLNNQRSNLRAVTPAQNQHNRKHKRAGTSSRYRGVSWRTDTCSWAAYIHIGGRKVNLGSFKNEADAARAYNLAGVDSDAEHFAPNQLDNSP